MRRLYPNVRPNNKLWYFSLFRLKFSDIPQLNSYALWAYHGHTLTHLKFCFINESYGGARDLKYS